jgi:Fe-S-cluster containining protein
MFGHLCDSCTHQNCCTDSAVPLVFPKEFEKIKTIDPEYLQHVKTIEINKKNIITIKKKKNSTRCIYLNDETNRCMIYESRPMDCKIYPFDILFLHNAYHWIVYSCNADSNWNWSEGFLETLENDEGFDELMKNIDIFSEHTNMILEKESKKTPYVVLRKVNFTAKIIEQPVKERNE